MRAVPAGGERHFRRAFRGGALLALAVGDRDDVDSILAEAERGFDCFSQTTAIFVGSGDAILDDLDTRPQSLDPFVLIDAGDLSIEQDAQISLLLEEREEIPRLSLGGN